MPRYNLGNILSGRKNTGKEILASAARTSTTVSGDISNPHARGGHIIVDVSDIVDDPTMIMFVQGKDPVSGNYYSILQTIIINVVDTYLFKVYPGITDVPGYATPDILPDVFRVLMLHLGSDSTTYSVSVLLNP